VREVYALMRLSQLALFTHLFGIAVNVYYV